MVHVATTEFGTGLVTQLRGEANRAQLIRVDALEQARSL